MLVTVLIIMVGLAVTAFGSMSAKTEVSTGVQEIHVSMNYIHSSEYCSYNISFKPNSSIVAYYNSTNLYLVNSNTSLDQPQQNISNLSIKPLQKAEGESYYYNLSGTYKFIIFSSHEPDLYYSMTNQTYTNSPGSIIMIIGLIIMLIGMVSLVMVIFFPEPEE